MIRRTLKVILGLFVLLLVLGCVGIGVLYNNLVQTLDIHDYANYADLPTSKWARVDLSTATTCSDGSPYRIYTRRGTSDNLIIHFAGGGAAWDGDTASQPIELTNLSGYYIAAIPDIVRAVLGGIFQLDRPENPFAAWNVVYIPYCTADFDIGNVTQTYTSSAGKTVTLHHNGRQNVTEALAWVFKTFDPPPKLLVSGESAGGFATLFWIAPIAKHYSTSDVYQLADGVYLDSPQWDTIVNTTWQADTVNQWGFAVAPDLTASAYLSHLAQPLPNVTYLHLNTLYDGTLMFFTTRLNNVSNDARFRAQWSRGLVTSMQRLSNSGLKYFYYITDYGQDKTSGATPHTSVSAPLFYEITQSGTPLSEWLTRAVIEGKPFSVGAEFMAK